MNNTTTDAAIASTAIAESLVFYWHPQSSASPVAAALNELDVPHERIKIDIRSGEQHRAGFLALNPNGKVPTLTVDGAPMFEGLAIQLWLGETYGVERGLWPAAGTPERLQAMSWCAWAYVTYGAVLHRLYVATQGDESLRSAEHAAAARAGLDHLLGLLDARLAKQPWIVGTAYSLADTLLASVLGFSAYVGAPVAEHAHVQAWLAKVQARPALQTNV